MIRRLSNSFAGASTINDMTPSSAAATASRPRPIPYSVTVSLSCNNSGDRRTIEIPAGKTVQIGRSSKSGFKGLYPSSTNALFDCAVVSRDHAELAMTSPWQATPPRVTIIDKGSLHGTTVNGRKLLNGLAFELHTGDVIELGEKITRGEDAHDGISLTFKQLDPDPHYRPRSPSPTMNRGYQVPESPDRETSDYDSEIDLESLYNCGDEESSAKTTPEQPKHKIGSQESPVNLEGAAGPSIVDISQEHDEMINMSAASEKDNKSLIIPETYDEDAEPFVLKSAPVVPAEFKHQGAYEQQVRESDDDDDVESVRMHNTGLCQILVDRDGATSDIEEDEHDDRHDAEESEEEGLEYGYYDSVDDADGQSDSAASDLINCESEPESDLDAPSDMYSTAHLQQDSPEPQDAEQSQQPLKTSTIHSVLSAEQPKSKAQYDPVRGSQLATEQQPTASASVENVSMPSASAYVYGFPGYGSAYENPATDFSDSSRWDIQPAMLPYDAPFGTPQYYTAPPHGAPKPFGAPFTAPPMFATQKFATAAHSNRVDRSRPAPPNGSLLQPWTGTDADNTSASKASQKPAEASSSKAAGKIAITDILDKEPHTTAEFKDDASAMIEEAKKMVAAAASSVITADSPSGKRKADEMEALPVAGSSQQRIKKSKQEAASKTIAVRAPAQRTRSRGTVRRVATTAAQYATAAAFGGAATIAFLSSPYAQSLIDFLG